MPQQQPQRRHRTVDAGDVRLAVTELGAAGRPPILLVHGYPDTGSVWDEVAVELAGRYHVITYDVRGAGASAAPAGVEGYRLPILVADMAAVIDAVSPDRPVHLVGHDWGAIQGWAAASQTGPAGRIASLTSVGGVSLAHAGAWLRRRARRGPRGLADAAGQYARSWYISFFRLPALPELVWRAGLGRSWGRILRRCGVQPRPGHPADTIVSDVVHGLGLYRANMRRRPARHRPAARQVPHDGRLPDGRVPDGRVPDGRVPDSRVPDGQGPDAQGPDGRQPPGRGRAAAGARFRPVDVPVQVVVATRDPFIAPRLQRAAARCAPRLWRREIRAGHWVPRTHPVQLARWIAEFADHVDGEPATRPLRRADASRAAKPFGGYLVVVTGAGSGIGRSTALAFASAGAEIVAADLDLAAARQTCADAAGAGAGAGAGAAAARPYQVDVASAEQMERFAAWVHGTCGVPDVVVNSAGVAVAGPFLAHTEADWRRVVDVNLLGVMRGCRLFGAQMAERGEGGHLVNIASAASFTPAALLPAYSATKAAVWMLGECLRAEFAAGGIGVTTICPGFTGTSLARAAHYAGVDDAREERLRAGAERAMALRHFPPEKVAAAVLRAVRGNRPLVPVNAEARVGYALSRVAPSVLRALARRTGEGMFGRLERLAAPVRLAAPGDRPVAAAPPSGSGESAVP